jgi:hypothetical protein
MRTRNYKKGGRRRSMKAGRRRSMKAGRRKSYKAGRNKRRVGRKSYKGGTGSPRHSIVGAYTIPLEQGGVEPGILCPKEMGPHANPRVTAVLGPTACGIS